MNHCKNCTSDKCFCILQSSGIVARTSLSETALSIAQNKDLKLVIILKAIDHINFRNVELPMLKELRVQKAKKFSEILKFHCPITFIKENTDKGIFGFEMSESKCGRKLQNYRVNSKLIFNNKIYSVSRKNKCGTSKIRFRRQVFDDLIKKLPRNIEATQYFKYNDNIIMKFESDVTEVNKKIAALEPKNAILLTHNYCKTNHYQPPQFIYSIEDCCANTASGFPTESENNIVRCQLLIWSREGNLIASMFEESIFTELKDAKINIRKKICENFIKLH